MNTLYQSINSLSLKDMDGSLLWSAIMHNAKEAGVERLDDLQEAIIIASYLHRNDTRGNRGNLPRDTYITHPLRNTLRLIRYGITDVEILIATVLHDTVEDHPVEILTDLAKQDVTGLGDEEIRMRAGAFLSGRFGAEVARLVLAVSNPIHQDRSLSKDQKRALYAEHVKEIITDDASVFLVKFADFYDNAGSLHHTTGNSKSMTDHLTLKYSPLVIVFREALISYREVFPAGVTDQVWMHLTALGSRLEELRSNM